MPDTDRIKGKIKQAAGADDQGTVLRGEQLELEGKAQELRGRGKDLARKAADRTREMRERGHA